MARTRTPEIHSARTVASAALAAALTLGLAACGGNDTTAAAPASVDTVADDISDSTPAQSDTTAPTTPTAPPTDVSSSTLVPAATDAPVETDPPVVVEATPELAVFAETNRELVDDWATQLSAFGEQAIDLIDDVSKAPAATPVAELSDELVVAIGPETTDPGLVTLRSFAEGASQAIGYAEDGDQDAALSVFIGLQSQADTLTAVLDQFDA